MICRREGMKLCSSGSGVRCVDPLQEFLMPPPHQHTFPCAFLIIAFPHSNL
ncbi:hypothetical protein BDW75DRAFT_216107, partial [Aspergillus navahoensis]